MCSSRATPAAVKAVRYVVSRWRARCNASCRVITTGACELEAFGCACVGWGSAVCTSTTGVLLDCRAAALQSIMIAPTNALAHRLEIEFILTVDLPPIPSQGLWQSLECEDAGTILPFARRHSHKQPVQFRN